MRRGRREKAEDRKEKCYKSNSRGIFQENGRENEVKGMWGTNVQMAKGRGSLEGMRWKPERKGRNIEMEKKRAEKGKETKEVEQRAETSLANKEK